MSSDITEENNLLQSEEISSPRQDLIAVNPVNNAHNEINSSPSSLPNTNMNLKTIPQFLNKLYIMVNDPATDSMIKWSDSGESFLVVNQENFTTHVLPYYFKHSNFSSFVRQLNMYGFHKVPHIGQGVLKSGSNLEMLEFSNPDFIKGQPDLLCLVTRKKGGPHEGNAMDVSSLMTEIQSIRKHQVAISGDLRRFQAEHDNLWKHYVDQQKTLNKIVKFLTNVYEKSKLPPGISRSSSQRFHSISSSENDPSEFSPDPQFSDADINAKNSDTFLSNIGPSSQLLELNPESQWLFPVQKQIKSTAENPINIPSTNSPAESEHNNKKSLQPSNDTAILPYNPSKPFFDDLEARVLDSSQNLEDIAEFLGVDLNNMNIDTHNEHIPSMYSTTDTANLDDILADQDNNVHHIDTGNGNDDHNDVLDFDLFSQDNNDKIAEEFPQKRKRI